MSFSRRAAISLIFLVIPMPTMGQTNRLVPDGQPRIFKCRRLIDPASGAIVRDALIHVDNGKILGVGSGELPVPEGTQVVDFGAKYIIPGLIDTHGHLYGGLTTRHKTCEMMASFFLAAGVTTVRSPGSMEPEGDIGLLHRINSGRFLGPRLFHSGPYIEAAPVSVGWMNAVATPEEVRLTIDQWIKQGATSVKVYAAMKGELLRTAIQHGHAHGVKVIGHIGAVTYREAILMGIDELFHGVLALPDLVPEDLEAGDYKEHYRYISELDLSRTDLREIVKLAARHGVVLTPTAGVVEPQDLNLPHMQEQRPYYTAEAWALLEKRLQNPVIPNAAALLAKNRQFIRMAHEAGCVLTTGTDQVGFGMLPGHSLWREMEIFAEAGLEPMEVLKAATLNGALALGRSDLLGSLKAGNLADFVVLDADPLENIGNVRKVHRVVKGGTVHVPLDLLKPLIGKYH